MSQAVHCVRARWRRKEGLGAGNDEESVLTSASDAVRLWKHGFYGVSPERDTRKAPAYGVLSLCEAYYLLLKTERDSGERERVHFTFQLQDTQDETILYSSADVLQAAHSRRKTLLYCRMLAYAHIRDLGWIVQLGLNYGADFLLYRESPEAEHATFTVMVQELPWNGYEVEGESTDALTWQQVVGLSRVATTARKRLIIAYVTVTNKGKADGQCGCKFLQVSRWNLGTKGKDDYDD